jgi:hypothetical protein
LYLSHSIDPLGRLPYTIKLNINLVALYTLFL